MAQAKDVYQKIKDLEDKLHYTEAMLEEVFEAQQALFPIFVDLVQLISKMYEEMEISDREIKKRMTRLRDTFLETDQLIEKYYLDDEYVSGEHNIAYT
jgi:hypothetical protein